MEHAASRALCTGRRPLGRRWSRPRLLAQSPRPRARDLGIAPGRLRPGPAQRHHRRRRRARRAHDDRPRRQRPHRRHRHPAPRGQPLPRQGRRRRLRRQRLRQAGRFHAGRRTRHHRNADRPHEHAERRHGRRRGGRPTRSRCPATTTCARSTRWSARPTTAALNDIRGRHVTRGGRDGGHHGREGGPG